MSDIASFIKKTYGQFGWFVAKFLKLSLPMRRRIFLAWHILFTAKHLHSGKNLLKLYM
jgi:hypothetical protein